MKQSIRVLGIHRNPIFSNNAIEADRLILEDSLDHLKKIFPHRIDLLVTEETGLENLSGVFDLVLTMSQGEKSLSRLNGYFSKSTIWNSPRSIRNCCRSTMSNILHKANVSYVPFQLIPTDGSVPPLLEEGASYWMKRGDFHATCDADVSFIEVPEDVETNLKKFKMREIKEIILQKHIEGDVYKFYGVEKKFFRPIKVQNRLPNSITPDLESLQKLAERSAQALGLKIYGGDAILDCTGKFYFIDLNDWPSFRLCRGEAAESIAELSLEFLLEKVAAKKRPMPALNQS